MRVRLKARLTYAMRIVFVVDLDREVVGAVTIEIDSLEHVDTRLTFRALEGVGPPARAPGGGQWSSATPFAALTKLIHESRLDLPRLVARRRRGPEIRRQLAEVVLIFQAGDNG